MMEMSSNRKFAVEAIGKHQLHGRMTLIAALLLLGVTSAPAQATEQRRSSDLHSPVVAVTYDLERAKTAAIGGSGFWLQGGGVDIAVPFYKGLGIAGSFSGEHASNIQPGVSLSKLSYLAGPRYTFARSRYQVFGEGLFGGAHGFDSIFPTTGGLTPTANSFAMQLGGGLDIALRRGFGIRAFELDYVRTALPNNGTNSQNDLRLAFGMSYHFSRK
jgi:peptidoglycan-associated lipoprotein